MDAQLNLLIKEIHPFERWFPLLHHYSREEFNSEASSLNEFVNYGKKVSCFREGENKRTVKRALMAVSLAKQGMPIEEAVKESWRKYPLATK